MSNEKDEKEKETSSIKWIEDNDFYEIIRDVADTWAENVTLTDSFFHPKKKMYSHTFRITYSPNDPSLKNPTEFNDIAAKIQDQIRYEVEEWLHVTLR